MRFQAELDASVHQLISLVKQAPVDAYEITAKTEEGFDVSVRRGDLENLEHHRSQSISLTVYQDQRSSTVSLSDFSSAALKEALRKVCSLVRYAEADPFAGLADKALMAYQYPDLQLYHPWAISPDEAADMAIAAEQASLDYDARISQVEEAGVHSGSYYRVYANSHDFIGSYAGSFHGLHVSVIASEQGQMERDHEACYSRSALHLDSPVEMGQRAAKRAISRLGAKKITTRRCPVIFERRVASSLIRHLLSAISGRNQYQHHSFLLNSLDEQVFPDFIQMNQHPHLLGAYGSQPFDAEGVLTQDLDFVRDGCIVNYVLASYSARKLGMQSTGNASGVYNLRVSHSDHDLASLCRLIGTGLLVTELMGQGVQILTGHYSRGAAGFWVENGVIQYPVHEITISGQLKEMYANIIAVGNDFEYRSNIVTGSIAISEMVVAGA